MHVACQCHWMPLDAIVSRAADPWTLPLETLPLDDIAARAADPWSLPLVGVCSEQCPKPHVSQAEQTSSVRKALVHKVEQVSEVHNIRNRNVAKASAMPQVNMFVQKSPVSPH